MKPKQQEEIALKVLVCFVLIGAILVLVTVIQEENKQDKFCRENARFITNTSNIPYHTFSSGKDVCCVKEFYSRSCKTIDSILEQSGGWVE